MVAMTGIPTAFSASMGERTPRSMNSRRTIAAAAAIAANAAAAAPASSQEGDDGLSGILAGEMICAHPRSADFPDTAVCLNRLRKDS